MESTQNKMFLVEQVGKGTQSALYNVPRTRHVAKVRFDGNCLATAEEYLMAGNLHKAGINVAKPVGLETVLILKDNKVVEMPALIQEELLGVSIGEMRENGSTQAAQLHACSLRNKEVEKAKALGFTTGDAFYKGNTIYNQKEDAAYLVDFEYWSKKD